MKIKNIANLFLIASISILNSSPITSHLLDKISTTPTQEFIRIYIALNDEYNFENIKDDLSNLDKNEQRELVISNLKSFYGVSQNDILLHLASLKNDDLITNIKPLWITNVIICEATGNAINELAERDDIRRIDFDEYRIILPDQTENNSETGNPDSREITWNVTLVNADDVWAEGYTGNGVLVAVIDTGVNYNHQDLADHVWNGGAFYPLHGYDFHNNDNNPMDDHGHGTHCAGTVAGDGTSGSQTGIAPDAQIMALKVLDSSGGGYESSSWEAIEFAVEQNVDIMSISLGWMHSWGPDRDSWRNSMNAALFSGLIASVAAANAGEDLSGNPIPDNVATPGDIPPPWLHPDQTLTGGLSAVTCVGATNSNDVIAGFSSRGPSSWENVAPFNDYPYSPEMGLFRPDVSAPGVNIKSLAHYSDTGYESGWSGTSMATPCVAGIMALMKSKDPNITPSQISEILEMTALHLGSAGKNNTYGSGRVDAFEAVNEVFGEPIPPYPAENPVPADDQISISLDTQLRWSNGGGAASYLVFMGTDNPPTNMVFGEWVDSPIYIPMQLEFETEYFWQITSINQYGETQGNIWSFTTTGPPDETYESGDFSQFPWEFQGYDISWPNEDPIEEYTITGELDNMNWTVTSEDSYGGVYSAKSAAVNHNQASTMSVTITSLLDDYIGFQYRVASEYSPSGNYFYDGLMFFIDDEVMGYYQPTGAGDTPWSFVSYPVPQGEHTFTWAFVKDGGGGSTDMEEDCAWIDDIYFPAMDNSTGNVTVELMADWNMVGLPVVTEDLSYSAVFPGAIENTLYYFSPTGYVPVTELTPGVGYWLRFIEENSLEIQGQIINNLSVTLNNDWNLITGISSEVEVENINDPQNLIVPNTIYAYGSSGYIASNTIQPGKGYWLRSSGEGDIHFSSNLRSGKKKEITEHLSCNTITINGNTLYFGNEISDEYLLSYSLPPLPPEDAFDVRFSDNMKYSANGGWISIHGMSKTNKIEYHIKNSQDNWSLSLQNGENFNLNGDGDLFLDGNVYNYFLKKISSIPGSFAIVKSFPNPFNPVTTITYTIPEDSYIQLDVFSIKGELIQQLENSFKFQGNYTVSWDGKDMIGNSAGSGIYIGKLSTGKEIITHKMLLLK
jgi:subtilisin family serine protease